MKKKIIIYSFVICFVSCVSAKKKNISEISKEESYSITNKIDNLKTTEDVVKFAKSINADFAKKDFGELQIKPNESIIKELNKCDLYKNWSIQNWQKIDINNDGKTDLLFTGYWYNAFRQYVIMETESDKFELFTLSNDINYLCKIVKPITVNNKTELLVNNNKTDVETVASGKTIHFKDTLTYKFNSFIELSSKEVNYDIENIKFISDNNFEIVIDRNGNAHYKCLNNFNVSNLKGNFYKGESRKKITAVSFNEIKKMLEYISVKDLPNEFTLDGYDFPTVFLEINFKDGSVKKIKDYGYQGTFGLNAIYDKMKLIALQTDWQ